MTYRLVLLLTILTVNPGIHSCREDGRGHHDKPATFALETPVPIANRLRGYATINTLLVHRLLNDRDFNLIDYLQSATASTSSFGSTNPFIKLMGAYDGAGTRFAYQGRHANTINMLLWYTVLGTFAHELSLACIKQSPLKLKAAVKSAIRAACRTPADASNAALVWHHLWSMIGKGDIPETEFAPFMVFVRKRFQQKATPVRIVRDALHAIIMNPHFQIVH